MNSRTTRTFRNAFKALPPDVRARAREAYRLWRENPQLPGLRFKRVGDEVSVRIGRNYRAARYFAIRYGLLVLDW